jgi:hypothetical protein
VLSALDAGTKGTQMTAGKTAIFMTNEEAKWLEEHLRDWWEGGFSGLDEVDLWLPQVTLWRTLRDAGFAPDKAVKS